MAATSNPAGLAGIELILEQLFIRCGFRKIGRHKKKAIDLYRQNQIHFLIHREPDAFSVRLANSHGAGICAVGWRTIYFNDHAELDQDSDLLTQDPHLCFEMVQRNSHAGFGNSNFQTLFDVMERGQRQRGYA